MNNIRKDHRNHINHNLYQTRKSQPHKHINQEVNNIRKDHRILQGKDQSLPLYELLGNVDSDQIT